MAKGADPESRLIGRRLKSIRIEKDLEVETVAARLGISAPSWYAYERGLQSFPHQRFGAVAEALEVTPRYLVERLFPAKPVVQSFKSWAGAQFDALASAMVDASPAMRFVPS